MSRLSKRHFWEWFKRHNTEYLEINKKSKKEKQYWLNELEAHLRAYFKFLGFGLVVTDKTATLEITVAGNCRRFKKADSLVALAPELPAWKINALIGPQPIDFGLQKQTEAMGIDVREFKFSLEDDSNDTIDVMIYHPLITEENRNSFLHIAEMVVYNLLGERSFGTDIRFIDVDNLSNAGKNEIIDNIENLPEHIGSQRSSLIIDDNGRLLSLI